MRETAGHSESYLPSLTYWLDSDSVRLKYKGRRDTGPGVWHCIDIRNLLG